MKNTTFKQRLRIVPSALVLMLVLCATQLLNAQQSNTDQSQSPYFHITSGGDKVEDFPLLCTSADVQIVGPIADVIVKQSYKNDGQMPIEAIYVFPASTRAAVYEMTMKVGDRIIKADIKEKNQARQAYETAKSEGKRASLLEQHRPNVFQMNVANIMPGEYIEVELKYNEFLIPEDKIYSFIYPTVVGPRFADKTKSSDTFPSIPYTKSGAKPSYDFDISLSINAGMPLKECISPSHKILVNYVTANKAVINLDSSEKEGGNRDFIYNYSLAGGKITQGTMLYEHNDEKFFLSVIEPPKQVSDVAIPPREYVFVMDVSGSMNGFPIDISKQLMKNLVSKLRPTDKFNVLLFASSSAVLAATSLAANQSNLNAAFKFIDNPQGSGGTRLLPALKRALALPIATEVNSRSVVVVTDGYVQVEREAFKLISENLDKSNLFAFGIGSSVNRHLIEGMANAGRGEAFIITEKKYAQREAERFRKYIQRPLLTNIKIDYPGMDTYDVIPSSIPDLMAERPIYVFGKYRGAAKGMMKISGHNGTENFNGQTAISPMLVSSENSPIRYLWAREKIRMLDDLNSLSTSAEDVNEVTKLGLRYNLLTKYTSFVAIDEVVAATKNTSSQKRIAPKQVKQPIPMPQGVSNYAVGFEMGIEGGSKLTELNEEKVLALVTGAAPNDVAVKLKTMIEEQIIFTPGEKAILNGNTLLLQFDFENHTWVLKDERGKVTKAFKEQFVYMLNSIYMPRTAASSFTISMIWI